jgi:Leucine-rich repeat (LRR) protein
MKICRGNLITIFEISARIYEIFYGRTLTKSIHLYIKTLLKATSLALISPLFINSTTTIPFAGINHIPSNTSHEESTTTIAGIDTVVPS